MDSHVFSFAFYSQFYSSYLHVMYLFLMNYHILQIAEIACLHFVVVEVEPFLVVQLLTSSK